MVSARSSLLRPKMTASSLTEIDLLSLHDKGIKGIILDLDNTISMWRGITITEEASLFIKKASSLGYRICLVTNAKKERAEEIAGKNNLDFVAPALKPLKRSFLKAVGIMKMKENQVAVIGDQLFTDIIGGNRAGCFTILIPPLDKKEFIGTKLLRMLEKVVGRQD